MVYREVKVNVMNEMYSVVAQSMTNWPFSSFLAPYMHQMPLGSQGDPVGKALAQFASTRLVMRGRTNCDASGERVRKGSEGESCKFVFFGVHDLEKNGRRKAWLCFICLILLSRGKSISYDRIITNFHSFRGTKSMMTWVQKIEHTGDMIVIIKVLVLSKEKP